MNILIAGDFCPQERVAKKFEQDDYEPVLGEVKDVITSADYSIVNYECPITEGKEKPIVKKGPSLRCSEKGIEAIKWAGFDCVTLANNHFRDFGDRGVKNTIEKCKTMDVDTVGGGMNKHEAAAILYKQIEKHTLAIINCCEHEFSIATETIAGSNPLNPVQQYYKIQEAKKKADYVLVIVHGGHEQFQLPNLRMVETYRFFIDAGADAVVNHHQHCYSGYEYYKMKPIFYGLGNFCFDKKGKRNSSWNEGYMLKLKMGNEIGHELFPYVQCSEYPSVRLMQNEELNEFEKRLKDLNEVIADSRKLNNALEKYYDHCARDYVQILEPFKNRYINFLRNKGLIPAFQSEKNLIKILDYIQCESHLSKMIYSLKKRACQNKKNEIKI